MTTTAIAGRNVCTPSAYPGFGLAHNSTGKSQSQLNRGRAIATGTRNTTR